MNKQTKRMNKIFYALLAQAVFVAASAPAQAQTDPATTSQKREATANDHVRNAVGVVRKMESVPRMRSVLRSAKGILIVPSYARAAVGVGAAGGTGILLVRQADGGWSDPVFYNTGGLSVGLQAGAQGGSLVLVLNNDKAVSEFLKKNNFSVNAKAGLTVVNWNKMVQGSAGTGDVVVWSDTHGLFGDVVTAEVNDIRFNQQLTNAYYRRTLAAADVIKGDSTNVQSAPLVQALVDVAAPAQ